MSDTATIPIDALGAVNQMLHAVGSSKVMSLETADMNEEAQDALMMLSDTAVEVQSRGWHFNTEEEFALEPSPEGFITLPTNAVSVKVSTRSAAKNLAWRGSRLYDLDKHTYAVGEAVYVDAVFLFEFADIPPPIRWYITALAGRKFGVGRAPDANTYRFTKDVEDDAYARALDHDMEARGRNLPERSPHFAAMRRR